MTFAELAAEAKRANVAVKVVVVSFISKMSSVFEGNDGSDVVFLQVCGRNRLAESQTDR